MAGLTNLWLDYYGKFECDLVLITNKFVYIFEIKDYDGHFEYRNSQCSINGKKIGANPISQAQRQAIQLQNLLDNSFVNATVQSVLVFTGPHCHVDIHSEVADMTILMRHQLRDYIYTILEKEKNVTHERLERNKIITVLNKYSSTSPIVYEDIPNKYLNSIRSDIHCAKCYKNHILIKNAHIVCPCGMNESAEVGIVRTIYEFSLVFNRSHVTTSEIYHFTNKIYTKRTVAKYLNKYFERVGSGRGIKYKKKYPTFANHIKEQPFLYQGYFIF